jgi:hypothetical protein
VFAPDSECRILQQRLRLDRNRSGALAVAAGAVDDRRHLPARRVRRASFLPKCRACRFEYAPLILLPQSRSSTYTNKRETDVSS